jgi:hypothetical protein
MQPQCLRHWPCIASTQCSAKLPRTVVLQKAHEVSEKAVRMLFCFHLTTKQNKISSQLQFVSRENHTEIEKRDVRYIPFSQTRSIIGE